MERPTRLFTFGCFVFMAILAVAICPVAGQSIQYGKLTGLVQDQSGAGIPGVQVEVTGGGLVSGVRRVITTDTGTYVFLNLPVGEYKVSAALEGFKTAVRENITIAAAAVVDLDFVLEVGGISETVTVSIDGPLIDNRTSTVETRISQELIENIPSSRDAFYDLTLTTPGMFAAGKDATWLPSPTAYGSGTNENVFMVNGVNTTNPRGGSWGSLVNVNYNTVEEVRVVALGQKAEYGSATGVAVDVITKSGGNEFHGDVTFVSQLGKPADNMPSASDDLGRDWLVLDPHSNIVSKTHKDREFNFTFGGPLKKNKVWFYGGFDNVREDLKKPLWEPLLVAKGNYGDMKITTEPFTNTRIWGAYHFEYNTDDGDTWGDNVPWDGEVQFGDKKLNHTVSTEWQWMASNTSLFTAKFLGFWTDWDPKPPEGAKDYPAYINWWKWQAFGVDGHFPYIEGRNATRQTIQADYTRFIETKAGDHDLKFGLQYTYGRNDELNGYFVGYENIAEPTRDTQDINELKELGDPALSWTITETHQPPFMTSQRFRQTGFFIDDQWSVNNRLTLNLGLRIDNMTNWYGRGEVYGFLASPAQVNNLQVVRERAGTGNIFNFTNWSPRLGATYSVTSDGKTVIRANYGRYYSPIGTENLRRIGPDAPLVENRTMLVYQPYDEVDLNHNDYVDPAEVTAAARLLRRYTPYHEEWDEWDASWLCQVAEGTKNQYLDQFTLNFERELIKDFSFGVTYIYKRTGNLLVNFPINRETGEPFQYERKNYTTQYGQNLSLFSILWMDYNHDGHIDTGDIEWINQNSDSMVMNMPDNLGVKTKRIFNGLQFNLNKRYADRWQMFFSLLYTDSDGPANRTNFQDWNIEGTMIMDSAFISSPNQLLNNRGVLPFTAKCEMKLSGSYLIPGAELQVGGRFSFNSGRAYWMLDSYPLITEWDQPENGVIDTVGEAWVVGSDPESPYLLPHACIFDLRLERSFRIKDRHELSLNMDIFNLFNANHVVNADYKWDPRKVTAVNAPPRKFRLGVTYRF